MSELNDPRVFFAAERTLLAWNRTSLALMAFGFLIERFGLLVTLLAPERGRHLEKGVSFWVGIAFVVLASGVALTAVREYRKVLRTLKPIEIPSGYNVHVGAATNVLVALLGIGLVVYLFVAQ